MAMASNMDKLKSKPLEEVSEDIEDVKQGELHEVQITTARGQSIAGSIDREAEKRLVWKLDLRILPLLMVMYLFNALDKTNLGNAKTAGLEKTLHLHGHQYNTILSIFYIPYVLTAPFLTILGKKYGPSKVLPVMMFTFGFMTTMTTVVKGFAGLMTLRWFLGMAESAFFPLVIYYQTTFYRRGELARRLAIFYAGSSIASAFGGLLAYGVFQIHTGSLTNWRYLFLIEGLCTIIVSVVAFFYLPNSAADCWFLNEEERRLATLRIQLDSSSVVNEPFNLKEALKIFKHPTSWLILGIEICLGVPLQSVSLFLPSIVARLKYSVVQTNLHTVFPNLTGAAMLLILGFASDYTKLRFPFVALGFLLTFIGFLIFATQSALPVLYYACFMMTWGTSAPSVILDVWYNNNIANENQRSMLTGVGVPVANLMGVVSSNIFRNQDAPDYIPAVATTAAFGAMGCLLTLLLGAWMVVDNKKRDRKQGVKVLARDIPTEKMRDGPANPDYRWFL